jgi:outer membrane protein OmpA-like peptidoglycan-associated protein
MRLLNRRMHTVLVFTAIAILAPARASWAQAEQRKSAEEILRGLLGGERGIGRARGQRQAGEEGRIALPIHFRYNSAEVTPESIEQLRQVATALNDPRLSSSRIRVEGHTDNKGSATFNQQLSERRAQAVKRYLVQLAGIAASRIEARGYGKSRPLPGVSQDTDEGRALNRRVEFVNLGSAAVASKGGAAKPEVTTETKPSVDVVVNYRRNGETKVLSAGSVLATNDSYRVTFTPSRDSYVYVYQISSNGRAEPVFPNTQHSPLTNPVRGKERQTVPSGDSWLSLDNVPGENEIIVLASDTELADAEAVALKKRLGESTTRGLAPGARADVTAQAPADIFLYRLLFKHQ